jgi:hypothetical protein
MEVYWSCIPLFVDQKVPEEPHVASIPQPQFCALLNLQQNILVASNEVTRHEQYSSPTPV